MKRNPFRAALAALLLTATLPAASRVHPAGDHGPSIDPNGRTASGDHGPSIDPNGFTASCHHGSSIDPDG